MKLLKDIKNFCEECVLTKQQEEYIKEVYTTFCKLHRISGVKLELTGAATFKAYGMKENVNGYFSPAKNKIVVKVQKDINKTIRTLVHELVHAYQYEYLNDMFEYGRLQQKVYGKKVAYRDSVHEQHARLCAEEIVSLLKNNSSKVSRVLRSYDIEGALYRINYNALAV